MFGMKRSLRKICIFGLAASMLSCGNSSLSAIAPSKTTVGALYDYATIGTYDGCLIPVISLKQNQSTQDAEDGKIYLIDRKANAAGTPGGVGIQLSTSDNVKYNLVRKDGAFGTVTANGNDYKGIAMYLRMEKQGVPNLGGYEWTKVWENGKALGTSHRPKLTLKNLIYDKDKKALKIYNKALGIDEELIKVQTDFRTATSTVKMRFGNIEKDIAVVDSEGNILSLNSQIGTLEEDESGNKIIRINLFGIDLVDVFVSPEGDITLKPKFIDIENNGDGTQTIKLGDEKVGTIDENGNITSKSGDKVGSQDGNEIKLSAPIGILETDSNGNKTIKIGDKESAKDSFIIDKNRNITIVGSKIATIDSGKIKILGQVINDVSIGTADDGEQYIKFQGKNIVHIDNTTNKMTLVSQKLADINEDNSIKLSDELIKLDLENNKIIMLGTEIASIDDKGNITMEGDKDVNMELGAISINREGNSILALGYKLATINNDGSITLSNDFVGLDKENGSITMLGVKIASIDDKGNITMKDDTDPIARISGNVIESSNLEVGTIINDEIKFSKSIGKIDNDKITILGEEVGTIQKDANSNTTKVYIGSGDSKEQVASIDKDGSVSIDFNIGKAFEIEEEVDGVDKFAVSVSDGMEGKYNIYYYIDSGASGSVHDNPLPF